LKRRSSSAWAKNALASFRISLALQLTDLAFQGLDALLLGRGRTRTLTVVALVLA